MDARAPGRGQGDRAERLDVLEQLEAWLRAPMLALSFAWLAVVIAELAWGSSRLLTGLVALLGAGGVPAFEPASEVEGGFASCGEALWWTGMLLATMGSEFWPRTAEGRVLCFLLALHGFAVFGYITASFAGFFVGRDAADAEAEVAGARDIAALREEIAALRAELRRRGEG